MSIMNNLSDKDRKNLLDMIKSPDQKEQLKLTIDKLSDEDKKKFIDLHSNISQNKWRGGDKDMECGPGEHPVRSFRRRDGTMVEAHCAKDPRPHEVRTHEQRERNGREEEVRAYRAK